ncbi:MULTISPECIES: LLM class flavin-dependent oxidoreductase [Paraburkholderia]|jgi:luciferase family oxidoreductase group 1|uniref:Luciferase-like monooxygenase n=1 Tax=Paraburkholderia caribensis TaxID=75105 RepID=A0A9Q6RZR9_9BURK|nr:MULTISPECIES: LLM class flavin-dependent oxidoreductase [Paraburkholderia]ALP63778.1 luciferase [Paraburkholderia caribensis]AMV41686.1 luciferase [Paraburkholderia caribensis]AUT50962.1 LLM class flavin-dependent oxidoreductase [Paraburkholderia caribensis]MCO4878893.1 LLM class flavin-dependent oxidoreductase [Paraburkholderia caribensis]MDR6384179.1 luciferase family oxidoreductase group 1 [Paraburkholderia caribensis]
MTLLSVLDQTPVIDGHTVADAIAATVELAQLADDLGYTRYWCAEHHGLYGVSNPCPEVMLARLGSVTKRIRIGSGGIMLPYYSPFKVAEQFLMLEALFPNRVDLGVGRAPGGDMRTAQAVAAGDYNRGELFPQQVADLVALMSGTLPSDHLAHGVLLQPQVETRPQLWVLGSSDFGGMLAAQLGIRFSFAHFINAHFGHAVAHAYRERFKPGHEQKPYLAAAVFVICADTEQQAADLEKAVDLRRVQMAYGLNERVPSIAQGLAQEYGEREQLIIDREKPRSIIGTPESVTQRLHALQEQFDADELIVLSVTGSYRARLRSYELLAEAFELGKS